MSIISMKREICWSLIRLLDAGRLLSLVKQGADHYVLSKMSALLKATVLSENLEMERLRFTVGRGEFVWLVEYLEEAKSNGVSTALNINIDEIESDVELESV